MHELKLVSSGNHLALVSTRSWSMLVIRMNMSWHCCRDAILHVCRIHRVLMQPRGNALLVGVGGSGRKSLSRLATYVADQKCFSIEISKGYRITEFREDLKTLYRQVLPV